MNLGDDLATAGVGVVAALLGTWIGARATRRASAEAFDRVATADNQAWRNALHYELLLNINLDTKRDAEQVWSFDTRVLRDSLTHAAAFSAEVLQRIIWARTLSEQMDDAMGYVHQADDDPHSAARAYEKVLDLRHQLLGELVELEKQLRSG
jgi:hypothetical protein